MVSSRGALVLAVLGGVLVGAGSGFGWKVSRRIDRVERERGLWPLTQVLVASHALPVGHVVVPEDLGLRRFPQRLVSAASLRPSAFDGLVGAVLAAPVAEGQPLEQRFFAGRELELERAACSLALTPTLSPGGEGE